VQHVAIDGLAQDGANAGPLDVGLVEAFAEAGVEQHRHARAKLARSCREREAGHPGHRLVGEDDVDSRRGVGEPASGVQAVARPHHVEAPAAEQLGHEGADHRLVLDEKDGACEPRRRPRGRDRAALRDVAAVGDGKQDAKDGAFAIARVDEQVAAVVVDDAVHHRQAHSGASADLLGREERLEHSRANRFVDAAAGVGDGERRPSAAHGRAARRAGAGVRAEGEVEADRAEVDDRVARVDAQVEEHLLDLDRVGEHRRRRRIERRAQRDRARQRRAQQLRRLGQRVGEPRRAPLAALAAREREHL